jgi:hypothetical protein
MFDEAAKDLHVDERKRAAWEKAQKASANEASSLSWFRGLIEKFQGNFMAIALGCFQSQFDRCQEAANFLNQVLEAYPSRSPDRLSLGKVKEDNIVTGKLLATEAIRFVHSIRKYHSHGQLGGKDRATGKFNKPNDELMLRLTIDAANQIGAYVGVASLGNIVQLLAEDTTSMS